MKDKININKIIKLYLSNKKYKAIKFFIEGNFSFEDIIETKYWKENAPDCLELISKAYNELRTKHYKRVKTLGEIMNKI